MVERMYRKGATLGEEELQRVEFEVSEEELLSGRRKLERELECFTRRSR